MNGELSLGQLLKLKRQDQGLSLEKIAHITRISLYNLQFLENDQYHLLPGEIYVRGYLKSYARVLRIDPEEIIKLYHEQRHYQNMLSKPNFSFSHVF
ncbi:MAG: helix-turn-helix domain-containing protein [Thermodesulfobacteriota bacterium]